MGNLSYRGFRFFLYGLLTKRENDVPDIARRMGIGRTTLYHYAENDSYFPPDLIAPLYNATKDLSILEWIIQDTDYQLTPRQGAISTKPIMQEATDVAIAYGDLIAELKKALADGRITGGEKKKLHKILNNHLKEVEEVRAALEREAC